MTFSATPLARRITVVITNVADYRLPNLLIHTAFMRFIAHFPAFLAFSVYALSFPIITHPS